MSRTESHDLLFFLVRRVIDFDEEEEAVELGLGQGVCAFLFDRSFWSREDEERVLHRVFDPAGDGGLAFLHRFEQGGLRLWRRPVDLVVMFANSGPGMNS